MNFDPPIKFTVVIPCYNEEQGIGPTVSEIERLFSSEEDSYELIVVNDGSTDGTKEVLEKLAADFSNLRIYEHEKNRGYGAALKTGIRKARSEVIAITDADETYPNELLPDLISKCEEFDMVVGARTDVDVEYSRLRAFPKYFLRIWMSWIAGRTIPDINSGMRIFKKSVVESFFGILPDGFSFTVTITLAMLTNYRHVLFFPIPYRKRVGRSKIRPIRDTLQFIMLILRTGVYFAPLRAFAPAIIMLLVISLVSLAVDVFVLEDLTDKTVLFFLFTLNTIMFALLADMLDKRTSK